MVLSTSKNSSRGFCAFRTVDVDAAAADSDAAAEEKRRLPSALDRDSITAGLQHNGSERISEDTDSRRERGFGHGDVTGVAAAALSDRDSGEEDEQRV